MAITQVRMYGPAQPGTTTTTLYTATTSVIVKEIVIANTSGTAATVTIAIGTAATAALQLVGAKSIPANDIVVLALSTVLNNADTLQALQSSATACTLTVSGVTVV